MTYRLLSLVVIFTQSIQLSKIVERLCNLKKLQIAYPPSGGLEHCCSRFNHCCEAVTQPQAEIAGPTIDTFEKVMVELTGIEPMTSCLQSRRSPN